MESQSISTAHIQSFRAHLDTLREELPVDPKLLDLLFTLHPTWPPAGKTVMSMLVGAAIRNKFTPLQPVLGIMSPPHYFSGVTPVLAFYLMTQEFPLSIPFASICFPDGRQMLEIFRLLLDTAGERTRYAPEGDILIQPGLTPVTRRLIERTLRSFPRLTDEGEMLRARALKDFHANSPS